MKGLSKTNFYFIRRIKNLSSQKYFNYINRFTSLQALLSDNTSDLSIYIATAMQGSIQTTVDDRAKVHPKNTIDISLE